MKHADLISVQSVRVVSARRSMVHVYVHGMCEQSPQNSSSELTFFARIARIQTSTCEFEVTSQKQKLFGVIMDWID